MRRTEIEAMLAGAFGPRPAVHRPLEKIPTSDPRRFEGQTLHAPPGTRRIFVEPDPVPPERTTPEDFTETRPWNLIGGIDLGETPPDGFDLYVERSYPEWTEGGVSGARPGGAVWAPPDLELEGGERREDWKATIWLLCWPFSSARAGTQIRVSCPAEHRERDEGGYFASEFGFIGAPLALHLIYDGGFWRAGVRMH